MIIGLISDSHGSNRMLRKALDFLHSKKVEHIVHCGDLCDIAGLRLLRDSAVTVWLTAGNMDSGIVHRLSSECHGTNIVFEPDFIELPLNDGLTLAATHGDNMMLMNDLVSGGKYRFVCHGHTHCPADKLSGNTRVICPGSLAYPRCGQSPACAILATASAKTTFYNLSQPTPPPFTPPHSY